jgi:hypothetical protein
MCSQVSQMALESLAERILSEGPISLSEAAKLLPKARPGRKVHTKTVNSWVVYGRHGKRLEAVRITGRGWWTSKQAVLRFIAGISASVYDQTDLKELIGDKERRERSERAKLEIKEIIKQVRSQSKKPK